MGKRSDHRKSFYETVLLIVLLGLSAGLCFGQEGANVTQSGATGSSTAQGTATFRASSRLVLVDVVVTDKAGQTSGRCGGAQDVNFTDTQDGRKHSVIDFVAALYSKDGKDIGHAVDSMNANVRPEVFEQVLKTGIPMHQELELKPGAYLLRLGVMERSSKKIGTVDVPLNNAGAQRAGK